MRASSRARPRIAITAMVLAVLTGAGVAAAGPSEGWRCKSGGWQRLLFRDQGECVSLVAKGGHIWNLADDFRLTPDQANPGPDSLDNDNVWHFLYSSGLARDPATYTLYPHPTVFDANREGWSVGPGLAFPSISIFKHVHRISVHPGVDQLTVVGWQSPVSGRVNVRGSVVHDGACGTGIGWWLDTPATTLASGTLTGAGASFAATVTVAGGDVVYVSVGPNGDADCDSTFLDLTISGPLK